MRSMFRINGSVCIDLGPDTAQAAAMYGDLFDLEHVLITHTHEDHFYYGLFETRALSKPAPALPLNVYLTGEAFGILDIYRSSTAFFGAKLPAFEERGVVKFHKLEFLKTRDIGGIKVTPLRGNHLGNMGENPANYLLELSCGKTVFYAADTGYFLDETFDALRGKRLDVLICECTNGGRAPRAEKPEFHLDFYSCVKICEELLRNGALDAKSKVYLTHLNHKHGTTHADMERLARESGLDCELFIAWDGFRI